MDIRDGFIVGIHNYCDSWCETCAFTSRCRVFADVAEVEASLDPQLQALVNTPLPRSDDPPPPGWMTELIDEMNTASTAPDRARPAVPRRTPVPAAHLALRERSRTYCEQVHEWLRIRDGFSISAPADPRAVIAWFHTLIPAKIARAVIGLTEHDPVRDWPADYDGSAKVALIGLDRSHVAWLQIVESGFAPYKDVARFIADVVWLGEALEQAFPEARAFVRPGFDEPEAVAKLRAGEDT
jgi:hypothetical protein